MIHRIFSGAVIDESVTALPSERAAVDGAADECIIRRVGSDKRRIVDSGSGDRLVVETLQIKKSVSNHKCSSSKKEV